MDGIDRFKTGIRSSINTKVRIALTASLASLFFLLMLFATDIYWNIDTISQGRFIDAYLNSKASVQLKGFLNFPATIIYSVLAGIGLSNAFIQLSSKNLRKEGLSVLPGFLAVGCASCGVGLASLLGLGAAASLAPFQGLGVKIFGITLMIYAIYRLGDAETCTIPSS